MLWSHHFRDCKSEHTKCALCDGLHIAVSKECPKRKEHIAFLLDEKKQTRASTNNSNPPSNPPPPPYPPPQPSTSNTYTYTPSSFPTLSQKHHHKTNPNITPQPNTTNIPQQNTAPNTTFNSSELHSHTWEIQLETMKTFAHMISKGDPYKYMDVMNAFFAENNLPYLPIPKQFRQTQYCLASLLSGKMHATCIFSEISKGRKISRHNLLQKIK